MVAKVEHWAVHTRAMAVVTGVEPAVLAIKVTRIVWEWVAEVPVVTQVPEVVVVAAYRTR
jgi:hypothetical protein